jgi:streptomycin 6-kinase
LLPSPIVPEPRSIAIPSVVQTKATIAGATEWLRDLPELIASIEDDWEVAVGERAFDDATEAYVVEVTQADGRAAVLKLVVPHDQARIHDEITVLEFAEGHGCVELLRADPGRGAMLLERLGPSVHDLGLSIAERHEILCSAAEQLWRPAPDCGLRTGADKGRWLIEFIVATWDELDRPCSARTVDHAVACAERRILAHDDERSVLVHGDVHQWNVLRAATGFKLVDPDGLLAEPEYDLGIVMREDPDELIEGDPRDRSRWLARRCGLDETAIWEWGVVERVSTGLLCVQDLMPLGSRMLVAADLVARRPD